MRITLKKIFTKINEWKSLKFSINKASLIKNRIPKECYNLIKEASLAPVTPVCYINESQRKSVDGKLPERYIAFLRNATIVGSSSCLFFDGFLLYDLLIKKNRKVNITDIGLFRIWNKPIHIGRYYICCYHKIGASIDKGIYIGGNFSGNLYHYVYEYIIKFYLIQQDAIPLDIPIIVDSSVKRIPQFKEILDIFTKRTIIYVDKLEMRKVSLLYYPSFVNAIPPNMSKMETVSTEDVVFDIEAILFLRKKFMLYIGSSDMKASRKIFISRKVTKWRKYNEAEIMQFLTEMDYEIVYPESMSYKEQLILFNQASDIVAASGAALTSIICCQPKTNVTVLISTKIDLAIFSTIAKTIGVNLKYISGNITNYNNVQSDFKINCQVLRKSIKE